MKKIIESILLFLLSLIFGLTMLAGATVLGLVSTWFLTMTLITFFHMLVLKAIILSVIILLMLIFAADAILGIRNFFKKL